MPGRTFTYLQMDPRLDVNRVEGGTLVLEVSEPARRQAGRTDLWTRIWLDPQPPRPDVLAFTGRHDRVRMVMQYSGDASDEVGQVVTLGSFRAVKVDASFGAIRPGDLLVSSPTAGHAMRHDDPKVGTVIGKALGSLKDGRGTIPIMVTPR